MAYQDKKIAYSPMQYLYPKAAATASGRKAAEAVINYHQKEIEWWVRASVVDIQKMLDARQDGWWANHWPTTSEIAESVRLSMLNHHRRRIEYFLEAMVRLTNLS